MLIVFFNTLLFDNVLMKSKSKFRYDPFYFKAKIKPMLVQNRCYAEQGWDREAREFCSTHDIIYQGFSLLTANTFVLQDSKVKNIAKRLGITTTQVIFRFTPQIGMVTFTGTTDEQHMREDLDLFRFELTKDELQVKEAIAG